MARTSTPLESAGDSTRAEAGELAHILSRLQDTILHPTPQHERRLRRSSIEREKLASNLEHVHARLLKLEQDAAATPFKSNADPLLAEHRETLELLFDRLKDLRQVAADEDELDDDSSDEEDLLGGFIPTPSQSATSTTEDTDPQYTPPALDTEPDSPTAQDRTAATGASSPPPATRSAPPTESVAAAAPAPTQTSQTLRGRHGAENTTPAAAGAATTTSASPSYSSARAALFANRRRAAPAPPETSTATAEAILDQQRAEQDALSASILEMAGALKASSHRFSSTLEADREAVGRASEGMSKTEQSMEAARGRMGTLRRMTEGKGWWGRMILYAWIYGLMLVLVLLVFVFPKLRF
ncbi:hypothetical protein ISF_01907 [Cordyceps fumosorosea ARSEF 2679]|uniref:Synaptobrevin n=1 Tax=Cordyceps fumosorosea (strain ARSEF 2679) TaxID=1081104 RepID=A0A168CGT3_CORFA|nr:hypothetical protein ISF_01907 [Cordyceps fumosorosea ARSEF 2679]OAA71356.1 hypothetical protein ISF_01907 [Cordyceps fumosorosea ARSEF 2679]